MPATITVAVEGDADVPIIQKILIATGWECGDSYIQDGKGRLDENLTGYNNAARFADWLVLRDLDRDADCAPDLVRRLLPQPARRMRFRVAVRSAEAWLLADREGIARFLKIEPSGVPASPEEIPDPKILLVNLARRSPRREIREDMVPADGTTARVGPAYRSRIVEFASIWNPSAAAGRSPSLRRCLAALSRRAEGS